MREIKFRAWDGSRMFDIARYDFADNTVYSHLFACEGYLGESLKVMQYTGLKDKNGEEIYEGDILTDHGEEGPLYVEYLNDHASFVFVDKFAPFGISTYTTNQISYEQFEVIGNIYENPELLEG